MSLNIEHSLKVQLNRHFSENTQEDGYNIVRRFLDKHEKIQDNINYKIRTNSPYNCDLLKKYIRNFALWNFVELLSFGEFITFYKYYCDLYEKNNDILSLLLPVKFIRNAAAHNNCLINSLKRQIKHEYVKVNSDFNLSKKLNTMVSKIPKINPDSRIKKMKIPVIHDFAALLFAFDKVVDSKSIKHYTYQSLIVMIERFNRNIDYFSKNDIIKSTINFLAKVVDNFDYFAYNDINDQKLK